MADFTFLGYAVDDEGIEMKFVNYFPPAEKPNNYLTIRVTDTELSAITSAAQLRTLVTTKLQRKVQASGIASKLDAFIGQTVTI